MRTNLRIKGKTIKMEKSRKFENEKNKFSNQRIFLLISLIFLISILIRFYYFDYNIPDLYFYYLAPMIVFLLWGLLVTSGRNKDSTKLIAMGVALYCAGGLGNRTELFFLEGFINTKNLDRSASNHHYARLYNLNKFMANLKSSKK